jgi:hypothetical protein
MEGFVKTRVVSSLLILSLEEHPSEFFYRPSGNSIGLIHDFKHDKLDRFRRAKAVSTKLSYYFTLIGCFLFHLPELKRALAAWLAF